MRAPWYLAMVVAAAAMLAGAAQAQILGSYQYVARTVAPATRTGAVSAGGLSWQCSGSECRIGGPWPQPGVGACAALAGQVGRIASYGRAGAMLDAAQLGQCNANLPAAQVQIDPNIARQARPLPPVVLQATPLAPPTPTPPPTPVTSQVAVEPGSRPQDIAVHVLSGAGMRFFGVSGALAAPALPPHVTRITSGRIDTPGISLRASAPGATPTPRSASTPGPPRYRHGATGAVILRVPVSLRDLPSDAIGISLACTLSAGRQVPIPVATSPYRDVFSEGFGTHSRMVARGDGEAYFADIGRYETVFDIPMQLRPFYRLQDARSYVCAVLMLVDRVVPPGVNQIPIESLADPARPSSRPPYHPAAGTTPILIVRGNIQ